MIEQLREEMKKRNISVYVIPTSDFHDSEYVGDFFTVRQAYCGFTGSAGTLVISLKEAALFTDGRYFVQAEKQLAGSGVTLMKMGEPGVPMVNDYIADQQEKGTNIGLDGRLISFKLGKTLSGIAREKGGELCANEDLAGNLWKDRPQMQFHKLMRLSEDLTGESTASKLSRVRQVLDAFGTDTLLLTTLDDIAWLFNVRGTDIPNNPIVYAFAEIEKDKAILYLDRQAYTSEDAEALAKDHVEIRDYADIYQDMEQLHDRRILTDTARTNYLLTISAGAHNKVIQALAPTTRMKAVKNETEIANTKKIHIQDGVAVTRFMYWLKNQAVTDGSDKAITEVDASDYLDKLRSEIDGYLDLSFETISAYGENAAMMHYNAKTGNCSRLGKDGMLLVDSGGQYLYGTTDVTRTFILGEITEEEKLHFTTVAKSMLRLMNLTFLYGCTGLSLDVIARQPVWELGMDYKCGTGHGVGHILNVHEGPNAFRYRLREGSIPAVLEEGMITTDEPGIYREGKYGIRTENELLCKKLFTNSDGTFMGFEPLTYVPIDLDGIDPEALSENEKQMLNTYHWQVYKTLLPYLPEDEKEWLRYYTRPI